MWNRAERRRFEHFVGAGRTPDRRASAYAHAAAIAFDSPEARRFAQDPRMDEVQISAERLAGITAFASTMHSGDRGRTEVLIPIFGEPLANQITAASSKLTRKLPAKDALQFALATTYLKGGIDYQKNVQSAEGQAYARTLQQLSGLGGLSGAPGEICNEPVRRGDVWITEPCGVTNSQANRDDKIKLVSTSYKKAMGYEPTPCAINYYTRMRWCSEATLINVIRGNEERRLRGGEQDPANYGDRNVFSNLSEHAKSIGDDLVVLIAQGAEAAAGVLCRGLTALLGETIGGFLCTLISLILRTVAGDLAVAVAVTVRLTTALSKMLYHVGQWELEKALMAFLTDVNVAVILLLGGPIAAIVNVPLIKAQTKDGETSIEELGERLAAKNPMFVVTLVMSVGSAIMVMGASGANPVVVRAAIGAVVMALAPAVAVMIAPVFMQFDMFKDVMRDKIETAIEQIIKLGALIVMAVITLAEGVQTLYKKIVTWWESRDGNSLGMSEMFDTIKSKLGKMLDALKTFDLKKSASSAKEFFSSLPILLLAIIDGEGLAEAADTAKAVLTSTAKTVSEARTQWRTISRNLTPAERAEALKSELDGKPLDPVVATSQQQMVAVAASGKKAIKLNSKIAKQPSILPFLGVGAIAGLALLKMRRA